MIGLEIARDFTLPVDAAIGRYVILGKSGAGKTNADAVFAEEFIKNNIPTIVLDPLGNMHGLRSSADGESAGLPIAIFGGEHGDVPLRFERATYVADMLAEGISAVLDMLEMAPDEQVEFAKIFLQRLIQRASINLHIILEEADRFAPNKVGQNPVVMFARTCRNKGIGWTFSTQKPQILHHDVVDTASVFVAMKMTGELAQDAIGGEIGSRIGKKTSAAMIGDLPRFKRGEAWFVPDGDWLDDGRDWEPQQITFRLRDTFQVRPPKVGEIRREPKVLAAIDLERLREAMAVDGPIPTSAIHTSAIHTSDIDDEVWALQTKVLNLEADVRQRDEQIANVVTPEPKIVEITTFSEEDLYALRTLAVTLEESISKADSLSSTLRGFNETILKAIDESKAQRADLLRSQNQEPVFFGNNITHITETGGDTKVTHTISSGGALNLGQSPELGKAQRIFLTVLAQHRGGCDRAQLGILSGYSSKSGTFDTYLSALRTAGYITRGNPIVITSEGIAALGAYTPLPKGRDLHRYWIDRVGSGPGKMLDALIKAYPKPLTRAEISAASGYSSTSGTFDTYLSKLRSLKIVDSVAPGTVRASEALFTR